MAGLLSKLEFQIMELLTQKPVDGMYGLEIREKSGRTIPKVPSNKFPAPSPNASMIVVIVHGVPPVLHVPGVAIL